jgi:hypothetical protein
VTFFSDPEHVWMAVLVGAATAAIMVLIALVGVWLIIRQFLVEQRELLRNALLDSDGVESSVRILAERVNGHGERLANVERAAGIATAALESVRDRMRKMELGGRP